MHIDMVTAKKFVVIEKTLPGYPLKFTFHVWVKQVDKKKSFDGRRGLERLIQFD